MELGVIFTVIGTGLAVIGLNYQIMRNFKQDVNQAILKMEENFAKHEKRFEMIDQRLFLLCLGKDLPSILKSEREASK
jgi:hypothetical protein